MPKNWISFFGRPDITLAGGDSSIIGSEFARFRNDQNATLQKVIPGRRQSFGSPERRRMYFKDIMLQIKDRGENKEIPPRGRVLATLKGR